MEELKIKISEQLEKIKKKIRNNCEQEEIDKEIKILGEMLEKYTKKL